MCVGFFLMGRQKLLRQTSAEHVNMVTSEEHATSCSHPFQALKSESLTPLNPSRGDLNYFCVCNNQMQRHGTEHRKFADCSVVEQSIRNLQTAVTEQSLKNVQTVESENRDSQICRLQSHGTEPQKFADCSVVKQSIRNVQTAESQNKASEIYRL